jgi:hypothetical protein
MGTIGELADLSAIFISSSGGLFIYWLLRLTFGLEAVESITWRNWMIRHTVVFKLRHALGSSEELAFMEKAKMLKSIPGVERFEQLRQISKKNGYDFGFSMEFADQAAYTGYNEHPDHVAFVRDRWIPEVKDFMEIDYEPMS